MNLEKRAVAADLLHEFCARADNGEGNTIAALFVDAGTVQMPHLRLAGRQQIHDWYGQRAKPGARIARHFLSNLRFSERADGGLTVRAYSMVTVLESGAEYGRVAIGTTTDDIVFMDGQAMFESRLLELTFECRIETQKQAA